MTSPYFNAKPKEDLAECDICGYEGTQAQISICFSRGIEPHLGVGTILPIMYFGFPLRAPVIIVLGETSFNKHEREDSTLNLDFSINPTEITFAENVSAYTTLQKILHRWDKRLNERMLNSQREYISTFLRRHDEDLSRDLEKHKVSTDGLIGRLKFLDRDIIMTASAQATAKFKGRNI